jgi:hypothetical protein
VTVVEALHDPQLFGVLPAFRDLSTWAAWVAVLKAIHGLPLDEGEAGWLRGHSGRQTFRPEGYDETVAVVGRQAGKSQLAAALASFEAALSRDRGAHVLLIAQDLRGAQRSLFNYCRATFERVPMFAREVMRRTSDTLELAGGTSLSVYPCRPAAVRGIRARLVVVDELAYFTATDGRPTDREMLRAVRPCLATTGGKLVVLSSPYGQSGALWDLHRTHYGNDISRTLVVQASAAEMNPTLPRDYLARMEQEDPEAFRSEVLGEFRTGIASLFDPDALGRVVAKGRRELAPVMGTVYSAFVDPSGGRSDAFTLAIGHETEGRVVIDVARAWRPPFNPAGVVAECAELLRRYWLYDVTGDRYAGEWPPEAFRGHGVSYDVSEKVKSDLYLELLAGVNSGDVDLLDLPELLRELRGLERRRGSSGRDRVDHRPGAHDDLANAVAGVVSMIRAERSTRGAFAVA